MKRIGKKRSRLEPVFPPDMDAMVQVSGIAVVALVACAFDALRIARALPGVALAAGVEYVAGLIFIGRRATAARINRILGAASHDRLTRLREQDRFAVPRVILALVKLAQSIGVAGYLCLDDTLIPHERSKKMKGVYWDHPTGRALRGDHALGRNVLGTRLVVLIWTDGFFRIPVGFAVWHKKGARPKYRTKNEIARTLLRWAVHEGIRPAYVAFDNWYASKANMKLIVKGLGLEFVTRLKKNTRLLWNGKKLQARTIGRRLLAEKRTYSRNGTWARATTVVVGELGTMTFVAAQRPAFRAVKDDLDGQGVGVRYLLGSAPRISAALVVKRYKSRWIIETFFEDLKQHLSLQSYQGRSVDGQMCHVALAFTGLVALDAMRRDNGLTLGEAAESVRRLVFARTASGECELVSLAPAPADALDGLDEAKEIVSGSLGKVSQLRLPEDMYATVAA